MKRLYGIGIGPGDPELITVKAVNLIQSCHCVFVPKSKEESLAESIAAPYLGQKKVIELQFPMGKDNRDRYIKAARIIDESLAEKEFGVFLTLGDPLLYSTYIYLMNEVQKLGLETNTVPGINSMNAAAAALNWPVTLRDESLYMADGSVDEEVLKRVDSICILKVKKSMEDTLDKLERNNFRYIYVKRCGQEGETILEERDQILRETDYMALILAKKEIGMLHFVGAGPGDADLITVKGRKLLEEADCVIYTGSLVSNIHFSWCKESCQKYDSATMTLEEVMDVVIAAESKGKNTVRLHTGDPTIFSTIGEQMKELEAQGIDYAVVPGVSSFTASCATLNREFTVPSATQTVIVTRISGKTPVPEREDLELLASHQCSMAIFLSVQSIERVVEKLKKGYGRDTVPVAVVYKATWPDQEVIRGTLRDIAEKVKAAGIRKFSQILVGDFLADQSTRSLLYHPTFSHEFRQSSE